MVWFESDISAEINGGFNKTLSQQECKTPLVQGLDISRVQLEDFTTICHRFCKAFQIGKRLYLSHTCSKIFRPKAMN